MPQTLVEKIFSRASGRDVKSGDFVFADIDLAMIHDITAPLAIKAFREIAGNEAKVWNADKVIMAFDHQVPADSVQAAENHKTLRNFAKEHGILNYDVRGGIAHQLMVENHVEPGMLIVGADSHTCMYGALGAFATGIGSTDMGCVLALGKLWFKVPESIRFNVNGRLEKHVYGKDIVLKLIGMVGADGANYKACIYAGEVVERLEMSDRMTMCNMAIEMGGKAGIVEPDKITLDYLKSVGREFKGDIKELRSDEGAEFQEVELDVTGMEPQVAVPHRVDNVVGVSEVEGTKVDQVFIGSCTNGRYEDLKIAAEILRGETVASNIRLIVIPASRREYQKALKDGLIDIFVEAGGLVEAPCCGPCMGGSFGLIASGEVSVSTSNRNFVGRQGSPEGKIYLVNPAVAAATAIYGEITDPGKIK
jgi:3-isopropylmalate/(R)-2-methylmalate dehydratase large subunit